MQSMGKRVTWVLLLTLFAVASSAAAATAAAPTIVDFTVPTGGIAEIAQAPDGTIWYQGVNAESAPRLGAVGRAGPITEMGTRGTPYGGLTVGREGDVWFGSGRSLTRFHPHSGFSRVPIVPGGYVETLTPARGGGVWFAISRGYYRAEAVGRATASGKVTEHVLPHLEAGLQGMVETRDGNVWFAESFGNAVGRLSPQGQ